MTPRPNIVGYAVLTAFAVAAAYALLSDDAEAAESTARGLPNTERLQHKIVKVGNVPWLSTTYDGKPVTVADVPTARGYALAMRSAFADRRGELPSDATGFGDRYSSELYYVPSWVLMHAPSDFTPQKLLQWATTIPVDEWGRVKPGKYGSTGSLGDVFTNLLANPLMGVVISAAAIALGPGGLAALGAYNMWQARGEELTLESAALMSARAYAVSQCGEACGMAFDFGVGVASGESIDSAAEDALYAQMTPEQRQVYNEAKQTYQEIS